MSENILTEGSFMGKLKKRISPRPKPPPAPIPQSVTAEELAYALEDAINWLKVRKVRLRHAEEVLDRYKIMRGEQ